MADDEDDKAAKALGCLLLSLFLSLIGNAILITYICCRH